MKTKIIILILFICTNIFAQESIKDKTGLKYSLKSIDKNTLILGFDLGVGTSFPVYKRVNNSDIIPGLSYVINARLLFFFSSSSGVIFDLGLFGYNIFEKDNSIEISHKLLYGFLSFSPFLRYKKFFIYLGPYIGIIMKGKKEDNLSTTDETDDFKTPDIGLSLGFGILLGKPDKTLYNLGLEIKYQLANFMKEESSGNKCFSVLMRFGIYFTTKHSLN